MRHPPAPRRDHTVRVVIVKNEPPGFDGRLDARVRLVEGEVCHAESEEVPVDRPNASDAFLIVERLSRAFPGAEVADRGDKVRWEVTANGGRR